MAHVHESPKVMIIPLLVLAAGACFAGLLGYENFVGNNSSEFWGNAILVLKEHDALENAHHAPVWVKIAPVAVGFSGIGLAYWFYLLAPGIPTAIAGRFQGVYQFLLNKWYFDEIYDRIIVRPAFTLGRALWKVGDGMLIDGLGPDGLSSVIRLVSRRAAALQTGYLYHYAFSMLIGVVVLVTWYIIAHAG
jgi:NADH-quinone oxidoreductase subunit L